MPCLGTGQNRSQTKKPKKNRAAPAKRHVFTGGGKSKKRILRDIKNTNNIVLRPNAFFSFSSKLTNENHKKNEMMNKKTISPAMIHTFMITN
jgi:hypothetical protein